MRPVTAAWMIFNFVLIILALYLILHLYQRIRVLEQIKTDRIMDNINEVFTAYLEDVRKENDRLASEVRNVMNKNTVIKEETEAQQNKTAASPFPEREEQAESSGFGQLLKEKIAEGPSEQNVDQVTDHTTAANEAGNLNPWVPPIEKIQDSLEESPFVQAVKLQKKGYTVHEIAKRLNRGEGEIELLLKFRNKVSR